MTQSHIAKKWTRKGKVLRAIIHSKLFPAGDKVHNNDQEDDRKQKQKQSSSVMGLLPSLVRVQSKGLKGLQKLGRVVSMRRDEGEERELCKKRIIMGRKCRPLNVSGVLHYDNNGVLVPEHFLSPSRD